MENLSTEWHWWLVSMRIGLFKKVSRRHLLEQESWWCPGYDVLRAEKKSPSCSIFPEVRKPSQPRQQPLICFLFPGMRFVTISLLLALDGSQWVTSSPGCFPGDAGGGSEVHTPPAFAQESRSVALPGAPAVGSSQPGVLG